MIEPFIADTPLLEYAHRMRRHQAVSYIRDGSCATNPDHKPRARQFYSRVLNRYLWRVHSPSMYDGCGTTLDGAIRVFRANNQLT